MHRLLGRKVEAKLNMAARFAKPDHIIVYLDPVALLVFLVIVAIAVWWAGQIMKGGGFVLVGQIINATVGAIISLFVIGLLKRAT
jgi:hypothetical protein